MMTFIFLAVAIIMIAAALGVVLMKNPVFSALCLILNMIGISVLFAMLDAHFLAVAQLIVYAGAIMVLVLFVLMLLSSKQESSPHAGVLAWGASIGSGLLFLYFLIPVLGKGFVFLQDQVAREPLGGGIQGTVLEMGRILFTRYVFPFEIASLLIMAALVGAIMVGSRSIHTPGRKH